MSRAPRLASSIAGMVMVVTACAPLVEVPMPSANGPRISDLQFDPVETVAGCTVTMRFRFETDGVELESGLVRWSVTLGKRSTIAGVTLPEQLFMSRASGVVATRLEVRRAGHYRYRIQVEDGAGRRSNVLEGDLKVEVSWAWWVTACARS